MKKAVVKKKKIAVKKSPAVSRLVPKMTEHSNQELGSFWDHAEALRLSLIKVIFVIFCGISISFIFHTEIIHVLTNGVSNDLVLLDPLEGFLVSLKVSLWVGIFGTAPFWTYIFLNFVKPALYPAEQKLAFPFLILSILALIGGLLFGFFITLPLANDYLYRFNQSLGANLWSLSSYLDFSITILIANIVIFQTFAVLLLFIRLGLISAAFLINKRRHAIVLAFIVGAILTPPDVLTQFLVALPLIAFYEIGILYAGYLTRTWRRSCLSCSSK